MGGEVSARSNPISRESVGREVASSHTILLTLGMDTPTAKGVYFHWTTSTQQPDSIWQPSPFLLLQSSMQ